AIAMSYMDRIGFADQPYLVYRHHDAGHQHMHIVSTSIQNDATCISLHNIARDRSEPARKAIELEFGLLVAENKKKNPSAGIRPIDLERASYGKLSTKRAISSVLEGVLHSYRFTSLAEFNALLRCFNVVADRGLEDSEMFKKEGLVYAVLDGVGNKIGVPLKASSFYAKPTLKTLEKIFARNSLKPKPDARLTARKIDRVISRFEKLTRSTLLSELRKNGVELVIRENESGLIYGTTYIDHGLRAVIKGSALGKSYGAKAIVEMLGPLDVGRTYLKPSAPGVGVVGKTSMLFGNAGKGLVDVLLADTFEATEPELLRKRKTARKRRR
ncbi:MAG: relaxase, partial [Sphingobacteriales bacterium]